jgi:hypothetical protein
MFLVEIRESYQSVTLHLRHAPQPGASYRLEIEMMRDDAILDARQVPFDLVFREPAEAAASGEAASPSRDSRGDDSGSG